MMVRRRRRRRHEKHKALAKMKVHWITLDATSRRAARFMEGCRAVGLDDEPLIVTRGDTSNMIVTPDMLDKLSSGQLGCMSSHLRMMDMAAQIGDEWFLVCEDDADLKWMPGWSPERALRSKDNERADVVKFHMHALPMMRLLDKIYGDGVVRFVADEPLDTVAYAIRPAAARRLAARHKHGSKWAVPSVPVDVWFRDLARRGELAMTAAPMVAEAHDLDSSITGSSTVLRFRRACDEAVRKTNHSPTTSKLVFATRMARETAREFSGELAVGAAVTVAAVAAGLLLYGALKKRH